MTLLMTLRWGLLGTARISRSSLLPALRAAGQQIVAVGSRDTARAEAFAREEGIARGGSYDDLLNDPSIEAVYNPLPNSEHLPMTLRALAAGKHVLCEKPLALNAAEVEQMYAAARRAGRVVLEAFSYRFHPQVDRALELVRSGGIGELRRMQGSFCFQLTRPEDIRWSPELGGGALYDVGCYPINLARLLAGSDPVRATGWAELTERGVDHTFSGSLEFAAARLGFDCSFVLARSQSFTALGTEGSVHLELPFSSKGQAVVLRVNGLEERFEPCDPYQRMVEHFAAVAGGETARWGEADALGQARTLDALFASAQAGRPVEL
ncbi:putative dehydrogenase [Deinobacterium chartae]|uniref:Putative dehydrogenase n=1 Tax=Deinobacterium chartae TaxID=521158 RepID=A0A841I3D5_9DEIO|nr:Gfo/Idh/MocA family oxidoreductase [Deinobacterium chartae]MBB6099813.1 putative dehydrogenase [Deinobacterium chartae]